MPSPDTPVFILHLYDRAFLNAAALRAVGYTKNSVAPPVGNTKRQEWRADRLIIATPNAAILYSTLGKDRSILRISDELHEHFMTELNRLDYQCHRCRWRIAEFPDDYKVVNELNEKNYSLFASLIIFHTKA
jgi:predicted amidohydrolase YtcJ